MQYAVHLLLCQPLCGMLCCTCIRYLSPCRYVSPLRDILGRIAGFRQRSVTETVWIVEENRCEYFIDIVKHVRSDYFTCLSNDTNSNCIKTLFGVHAQVSFCSISLFIPRIHMFPRSCLQQFESTDGLIKIPWWT